MIGKNQKWIQTTKKCWWRAPQSFPAYPEVVSNLGGTVDKWLEQAKIEPLWAKEWRYIPGWSVGPRVVNDSFWFWFKDGRGWATIGPLQQRFYLKPGDLLLIPRGFPHTIHYAGRRRSTVITVHFQVTLFSGVSLLTLLGFPYVAHGANDAPFGAASAKLAREFALQEPGWKQAMRGLILAVLLYLIRHHGRDFHLLGVDGMPASRYLPRLLPVLEWMEAHLPEPDLSVRDLARQIGVSEVYLRLMFQKALQISPIAYVCRCRLARACALLRSTQMNIKEISSQTGFVSESFFIRGFCKLMGMTPSQYRADIISGQKQM